MTMACHEIVDLRQDDIIAYYQNDVKTPVHQAICGGVCFTFTFIAIGLHM